MIPDWIWWCGGGVSLVAGGWLHYLWLIPRERVPARPWGWLAVMILGTGAGLVGLALGLREGLGAGVAAAAAVAGAGGLTGLFGWLLTVAPLPDGALAVGPGDPLLDFAAEDSGGGRVGPADWRGQRVLLKFFRGHW